MYLEATRIYVHFKCTQHLIRSDPYPLSSRPLHSRLTASAKPNHRTLGSPAARSKNAPPGSHAPSPHHSRYLPILRAQTRTRTTRSGRKEDEQRPAAQEMGLNW
uniref:Uncharacterized protein n=1 Tax=Arundo donax TaxID=35708 RepID=A0A0A9R1G1_ARUDO